MLPEPTLYPVAQALGFSNQLRNAGGPWATLVLGKPGRFMSWVLHVTVLCIGVTTLCLQLSDVDFPFANSLANMRELRGTGGIHVGEDRQSL